MLSYFRKTIGEPSHSPFQRMHLLQPAACVPAVPGIPHSAPPFRVQASQNVPYHPTDSLPISGALGKCRLRLPVSAARRKCRLNQNVQHIILQMSARPLFFQFPSVLPES